MKIIVFLTVLWTQLALSQKFCELKNREENL